MAARSPKQAPASRHGDTDINVGLAIDVRGPVAVLTLTAPERRNALSLVLIESLEREIARLSADLSISAVVVAAEGPVFCSGHDLRELRARRTDPDRGEAFFARVMTACSRMMQAIVTSPKPFIAAVQGTATAAGCQLVATCDLAVAAESATFCTPGVSIGLFCSTPMVALSRNVSRKRALEMLLLGEHIAASDAADYGLINRVVPDGQALAAALDLAQRIADRSPKTISIGKRAFYAQIDRPLTDAYAQASRVMVENMLIADAEEGISAFLDKRHPIWKGE